MTSLSLHRIHFPELKPSPRPSNDLATLQEPEVHQYRLNNPINTSQSLSTRFDTSEPLWLNVYCPCLLILMIQ